MDVVAEDEEEPEELEKPPQEKPEKLEDAKGKSEGKRGKASEEETTEMEDEVAEVDVEGEVVQTSRVSRGDESAFFTKMLDNCETPVALTAREIEERRTEMTAMLKEWKTKGAREESLRDAWGSLNAMIEVPARDLAEKLRLILEPTQASRLKGDYRTGKRLNMRKIIPYIASQFRKDKIWLRRTKPSKRNYQIALAIDDSQSMVKNNSEELAFESLALISKALGILEAGELAVMSFGERVNILHPLGEAFTERSGSL